MTAPDRPADSTADLKVCDREPIHTPGAIQPHGALLVARAGDRRITHASANLGAAFLGRPLEEVVGPETGADIEKALADESGALTRICGALLPAHPGTRCDLVVSSLRERIYLEFEPISVEAERDALLAQAHAVIGSMRRARTRQELCERAVREMRTLTGYDRVMAYRFDPEGHGEVIAEARADRLEPFLGLRYPASDIPRQARRLYLQQRVRVIADVDGAPIPLLADPAEPEASPLDLSYCALRAVSPLHLEYLRNMGVRATLAISVIQDDALWGMLICHDEEPRRVCPQLRALCDLIGQLMSLLIGTKGQSELLEERLKRRSVLDTIAARALSANSVVTSLVENAEDMLRLVAADGAFVRIGGKVHLLGRTPDLADAARITASLRAESNGEPVATDALGLRLPHAATLAETASGALTLPSLHDPEDAITWFRGEVVRTVTWGGDPNKPVDDGDGRLSPRRSFAAWTGLLEGRSHPWDEADLEAARDLRRIVTTALLRQAEAQARLAELRLYDPLTRLPNRRALQERLEARAADFAAPDAAMIFLDLDRFKSVNDTLGHAAGDELLVQVANRLFEVVPEQHLVVRLGGDEFVVLCENLAPDALAALADAVVAAFRAPFLLAGRPCRLTTSVGVAPASSFLAGELMRAADTAMYAAKQAGGNQAVTFDAALHAATSQRLQLEADLHTALERGQFELHYQPIVDVGTGGTEAFEALLRWRHPARGLVVPADFIPLAEETGLIVPIGAWVLREALRQVAVWRRRFRPDLAVAVNISGQQAARPDFPAEVASALADAGLSPSALVIDITESILVQNASVAHLAAVRAGGVRIAVDDFGTGYSSIAYLRDLPIDDMKIDKLFIRGLGEDARQTELAGVLVRLGRTLGLNVVAEGVENERQWRQLRTLGCQEAQGYWLGRPLPPAEAELAILPAMAEVQGLCP